MLHRTLFDRTSFALMGLLALTLATGACGASPTADPDPQVSTEPQFKAWEESLALTSPFPRFIFLPLNNPDIVPVDMASHMKAEDLVVGVVIDGQPRAYPLWVFGQYHVVNDTINDVPIVLAYCEICSGASAFNPVVEGFDGQSLSFQIHGIARGTFTVYDYQTQTVWSPFTGRTLEGSMHPSKMERIPVIMETWKDWAARYPETEVLFASSKFREREHMSVAQAALGHEYIPQGFIDVGNMSDTRLAHNAFVFGVTNESGDQSIAFPLEFLDQQEGMLKYPFDDAQYLLQRVDDYGVVGFRLRKDQEDNDFQVTSDNPFQMADDQGGSWDEFGRALNEGGEDLLPADGYFTEWYEWISGYPESGVAN